MLVISIPSDLLFLYQNINENISGTANIVIVVVGRWVAFYRVYDRQNVLASNIS